MIPMEVYTIRLPQTVIEELRELAAAQCLPPRSVVRSWVMQRLENEMNMMPAVSARIGTSSLTAGAQPIHEGAIADESST